MADWTFLTNHAHVLLCLARDSGVRLRDVADKVGITERAAQRIVADLESGGYVVSEKVGRRNHYSINRYAPLRHPLEEHQSVGELLRAIDGSQDQALPARGSKQAGGGARRAPGRARPAVQ